MKNAKKNLDNSLKTVAKTSFIVFGGIIFSKIFSYFYRITIARGLGPEAYGLFSLALMISVFFVAFFSLGLQNGLLRYISFYRGKNELTKIQTIFRFSIKITLYSGLFAGILLFLLSDIIAIKIFHNANLMIFLKWFAVFLPVLLFAGLFNLIPRAYEEIGWYSFISNVLQTIVQFFVLLILLYFGLKNESMIFSYNISMLSILIGSFIFCKLKVIYIFKKPLIKKENKHTIIKELLGYSWPLMFFGLATGIFSYIDSFTIGYFKGIVEVGIYNAAIPISFLLLAVPELFIQLLFPLITKEFSKGNYSMIKELSQQVGKWIFILNLPFFIIMFIFPEAILNIVFGPQYISAKYALKFLAIGYFFYSIFIISDNLISMSGKSKQLLLNIVLASIFNFFLNILFVPKYGITGAAFATMLSYIFLGIFTFSQSYKYVKIIPLRRKMLKIALISIIPTFILLYLRNLFAINLLAIFLIGILFFLLYFLLILLTGCFDRNDIVVLKAIKNKIYSRI